MSVDLDKKDPKERIEGRSLRQIALSRLRKDRVSLVAITLSLLFTFLAGLAPVLRSFGIIDPNAVNTHLLDGIGLPVGAYGGMSWDHPLGLVPGTGSDLLSRLLVGITFSVVVGICATLIAVFIGLVMGLIAGFVGGRTDFFISRFIDLVLCFPQTLMLLALSGMFIGIIGDFIDPVLNADGNSPNLKNGLYVVLVLGLFGWPTFARVIRGQVLTLRNREFVEAARSLGSSKFRLYFTELLPNLWAPILVYATLLFPAFVSAEAALSFLGVGIKPPTPTLGNMITDAISYSAGDFMYFIVPVITIATLVLSFNLVGDGLRDALDPKRAR